MKTKIIVFAFLVAGFLSIPVRHYFTRKYTDSTDTVYSSSPRRMNYPNSVAMLIAIDKHAEKYNIPKKYAFGIAYTETSYKGPMQWNYNPSLVSPAGALGPMQIMPSTADMIWGEKISRKKLLTDINFNVETSMILLKKLYDKYKNWKIVFGCYNTGTPCVNEYAEKVYNFKPSNI